MNALVRHATHRGATRRVAEAIAEETISSASGASPDLAVGAPTTIPEAWIMCLHELRPIGPEGVDCPRRPGAPVSLATCLECHLLITLSAERSRVSWCTVDDD